MIKIYSLVVYLLIVGPAFAAAPTYDNATTLSDTDAGSTSSFSHTTGSCANRFLWLVVTTNAATPPTLSSATYNGVGLTVLDSQAANVRNVSVAYLKAPATGSNTLSLTLSAAADETQAAVVTYCGVDQSTPIGTQAKATGADAGPATVNVSSAAGELVVDGVMIGANTGQSATVGGGQTQRVNFCYNSNCDEMITGASEEAGAGTTTMSWTMGQVAYWAIIAVPLKPAATTQRPIGTIVFQ